MKTRFWMIAGAAAALAAGGAAAQVPPDIEAKLREIGRVVAPVDSAKLYRPLFTTGLPATVSVTRDVAFGSDPKQVLNVYAPAARGAARPVLVFVPGGQGAKQMGGPEGEPFYDNMGGWGVKNGLVVVTTQYRTGGGAEWDAGARDVASTIQWVKANAARFGGDPNQVFVFGQSNGATQLATLLGHRDLQGPNGLGVKGAILMSGNWNILPIRLKSPPARFVLGGPGGPPGGPPGPPGGARPEVEPAVMLQRSNLEGLKATTIPLMLVASELDPEERVEMVQVLSGELRKAGRDPVTVVIPGHSHMSEVLSFNTADESASAPVLRFIRDVR